VTTNAEAKHARQIQGSNPNHYRQTTPIPNKITNNATRHSGTQPPTAPPPPLTRQLPQRITRQVQVRIERTPDFGSNWGVGGNSVTGSWAPDPLPSFRLRRQDNPPATSSNIILSAHGIPPPPLPLIARAGHGARGGSQPPPGTSSTQADASKHMSD